MRETYNATDEGLRRAMEALAQRQTRTDTKVPTIAKERQVPAALVIDFIGSGGRDRTADLGVMNPTL